jgi:hypothetical protein
MTRRVVACVAACAALSVLTACGGGDDDTTGGDVADVAVDGGATGPGGTLALPEEPVVVESVDRRPAILSELGGPEAFVITVDEFDGTVSRFESWSYYSVGTQIDFVDGELLWDIEIAGLPGGSLLPLAYDPTEFTMLASVDATLAALGDVDLQPVDAASEFDHPDPRTHHRRRR